MTRCSTGGAQSSVISPRTRCVQRSMPSSRPSIRHDSGCSTRTAIELGPTYLRNLAPNLRRLDRRRLCWWTSLSMGSRRARGSTEQRPLSHGVEHGPPHGCRYQRAIRDATREASCARPYRPGRHDPRLGGGGRLEAIVGNLSPRCATARRASGAMRIRATSQNGYRLTFDLSTAIQLSPARPCGLSAIFFRLR